MSDEQASANVNRSYSLAASSIAIFTFMLFLAPSLVLFSIRLIAVVGITWPL